MNLFDSFARDQKGTTAIQYALIAGVLSLAVLTGSLALRGSTIDLYDSMANEANGALISAAVAQPQAEAEG